MAHPSTRGSYEDKYGRAPFHESAFKKALRLLSYGAAGVGDIPQGANFGEGLLAGFAGGAQRASAAQQAAQEYAERRRQRDQDEEESLARRSYMEAQTEALRRPPKPEKAPETHDKAPWYMRPEWRTTPEGIAAQRKASHIEPKEPKEAKPPKPDTIPRRIPSGYSEADVISQIEAPQPFEVAYESDPRKRAEAQAKYQRFLAFLASIAAGRGEADSPDIRRAAQLRLNAMERDRR